MCFRRYIFRREGFEKTLGSHKIIHIARSDLIIQKFRMPLIQALEADGHEVWVACSEVLYMQDIKAMGYPTVNLSMEKKIISLPNLKALLKLILLIRRERFDIVHAHAPIGGAIGRIAAYLARVPIIIYTTGGFYFHDNMSRLKRRSFIEIEKMLARFTDAIFLPNKEDNHTAYRERIAPPKRVFHTGFAGVDLCKFSCHEVAIHINIEEKRDDLGIRTPDEKVVTFIGRLYAEKGCREFVESAAKVHRSYANIRFLIVGAGPLRDNLQKLVEALQIDKVVAFTDWREDIPEVLFLSDMFVLPSYREGLPVTIVEAMAMQKPVIATNIRGCRELINDGENGILVPVKDSDSLAEAILTLLHNEDLAKAMGKAGFEKAKNYGAKRFVREQIDIYDDLIELKLHKNRIAR